MPRNPQGAILWIPNEDNCYHYPIDPWTIIDAELHNEQELIRDHYNGTTFSTNEANAKLTNGNIDDTCNQYWSLKADASENFRYIPVPFINAPIASTTENCDDMHETLQTVESWLEGEPIPESEPPIIGVLIEYCCEQDSELCQEK